MRRCQRRFRLSLRLRRREPVFHAQLACHAKFSNLRQRQKAILSGRYRTLLQNVAHESPALQVGQFSKVAEHTREIHPDEWIDPGNIRATEAKVDPSGAGFKCGSGIVEGGGSGAEYANALSRKSTEIYLIGRMGITLGRKISDKGSRSPPASAAIKTSCEDDLSRMDAFDPVGMAEMSQEEIAGGLDQR